MWNLFTHVAKMIGIIVVLATVVLTLSGFFDVSTETSPKTQQAAVEQTLQIPETLEEIPEPEVIAEISEELEEAPAEILVDTPPVMTAPVEISQIVIPSRYNVPPVPLDAVTERVLPSLVNILCTGGNTFTGASGSGIVIDPRGVILTNAHVAQYFLLGEYGVSCTIRVGAPAKERYTAELLFLPTQWAEKHAADLLKRQPTGTGEHDWALLRINGRTDLPAAQGTAQAGGSQPPKTFPFIPFDTREHIAIKGDPVLLSSYPAGFLGGISIRRNLWPASTTTTVKDVFTFESGLVDIISLGGTIVAQSGSSGGAVVNQWGQLVGIIVTSTLGSTTDDRDLRAMTLAHIERSMFAHFGTNLAGFLNESLDVRAANFQENIRPYIWEHFSNVLD